MESPHVECRPGRLRSIDEHLLSRKEAMRLLDFSKKRLPELDGLRGIAIALVIGLHYFSFGTAVHNFLGIETVLGIGWSGVDLFFVLSGFLIGGILLDARETSSYFKTFYARRTFRIMPIYYVWILAYVVFVSETHTGNDTAATIAQQVLFLQNLHKMPYTEIGIAWFGATWSLAIEEQFYLLAPLVIRFIRSSALYLFWIATVLLAVLLRIYLRHLHPVDLYASLPSPYRLMPCRADALAIGVLTALTWRQNVFRKWLEAHARIWLGTLLVTFLGVAAMARFAPNSNSAIEQTAGYTWIALFYAVLLVAVLSGITPRIAAFTRMRVLRELGKVSYCMYLIHVVVGILCQRLLLSTVHSGTAGVAVNALAVVVCYGLARLSWQAFEGPLVRRAHRFEYV
jgi:peptidoglycan/LPS O-acetylase OafA/YrhL